MEDSDNGFYYDMAPKLDFAKYEIKMIEYGGETMKLKTLIDRAVIKGLILYRNIDFLPYPPNTSPINTKFFNLFLGFKAQPTIQLLLIQFYGMQKISLMGMKSLVNISGTGAPI